MVEAKCINIDTQKATHSDDEPLSAEQWQALVALHRTLLYEHHDFLMVTQHPSANPALLGLAAKYSMPARMWKHGIHAFLEVLRLRQPESQEYMLAFIYLAYQMMSLLLETVPTFTDTWIECLGDLARYRMAVEDKNSEVHSIWGGVASRWYAMTANRHPLVGRLYHHSGILERPSLRKFNFYARALTSVVASANASDSLGILCSPGMTLPHRKPPSIDTSSAHSTPVFHDVISPKSLGTNPWGAGDFPIGPQDFDREILGWQRHVSQKNDGNVDYDGWTSHHETATVCAGNEEGSPRTCIPPPDLGQAALFLLPRVSLRLPSNIRDYVGRCVGDFLDRLACGRTCLYSVLKLSAALYIADNIPIACAGPIPRDPAHDMEAGLQTFWRITLTLAPLFIVAGGACRVAWILLKHERPRTPPIWSGAFWLIASSVWGFVRTADSAFTKEQGCILAINAAIWAEFVADSSRLVNNKARYLVNAFLGGGLLTLALLALDFTLALENGQADGRSKYMTQAVSKGPFLLSITTLGIYICQKYLEGVPTGTLIETPHEGNELQPLRTAD